MYLGNANISVSQKSSNLQNMIPQKRVQLSRTEAEWAAIDAKAEELKKRDFNSLMRSELQKIKSKFDECPICITPAMGKRKKRNCFMDQETYDALNQIAKRMQRPVASVVDEFIISRLITA